MTIDEAIDIIKKYDINGCGYCHQGGDEVEEAFDMAIKALEQEPKTGHWIFDKERLGYWISTCSECEHIFHGNEVLIYKPKFCPNCGVKMVEP